ncbi:MAG: hypothetical protein WCK70_03895 [Chloroflexales bacterium]|jgi:hypothetical protein
MPLSNAVANPIINDPFAEPGQHYDFSGDSPTLRAGRRPVFSYLLAVHGRMRPSL